MNWGGFTLLGRLPELLHYKRLGVSRSPSVLTSVLIKKAAGTVGVLGIMRLPRDGLGEEMRLVAMKH